MAVKGQEQYTYTACMGTGCHENCVIKTIYKDGEIVRTERAVLGEPEGDRYGICQKGIEYPKVPYLSKRLLYPMKRVGQRGDGKFERISWEQAMDEIGAKLRDIRDKYGPRSVLVQINNSGYPDNITPCSHLMLTYRFIHAFDATSWGGASVDSSCFAGQQLDFGSMINFMFNDPRLFAHSKHIIIWASNPLGATRAAATTRYILDAQENGAKVVHISLTYTPTSAKADQWVPIRAATDAALALAMCNILVKENRYDEAYVRNHTVAPFLVRQDNGKLLRESDIQPGGDPGKYVFWNTQPAEARSVAPHVHDYGESLPDLDAVIEVNGIPCKTAFQMLRGQLAEWTPERQAEMTGVPPETVRTLVDEYMANKPAMIVLEEALRYTNGVGAYRAIQLFAALSGFMGMPGGGVYIVTSGQNHASAMGVLNDFDVMFPEGLEEAKGDWAAAAETFEEFRKPEPKYHALLNVMGNIVHLNPCRKVWTDEFFPKLDLSVVYDVQMSETALLADYVLPDTTTFERLELIIRGNHIMLQEPVIEPLGEVKPPAEFWRLLSQQVGLGQFFDKTSEEWAAFRLQSYHPAISDLQPPVTLERLKQEKMVRLDVPAEPNDPFASGDFTSPSGQIEFYCEDMTEANGAMAQWRPPLIYSPQRKQYPLQLLAARNRILMQSQLWYAVPDLIALVGPEPLLFINPVDAKNRGIRNGDLVEVLNERGTIKVKASCTQTLPPGTVQIWYSYRDDEYPAGGVGRLGNTNGGPETVDDFARRWGEVMNGRWRLPPGEKPNFLNASAGRLPNTVNWETMGAGNYDSIWDNTCEVRKVEEV